VAAAAAVAVAAKHGDAGLAGAWSASHAPCSAVPDIRSFSELPNHKRRTAKLIYFTYIRYAVCTRKLQWCELSFNVTK